MVVIYLGYRYSLKIFINIRFQNISSMKKEVGLLLVFVIVLISFSFFVSAEGGDAVAPVVAAPVVAAPQTTPTESDYTIVKDQEIKTADDQKKFWGKIGVETTPELPEGSSIIPQDEDGKSFIIKTKDGKERLIQGFDKLPDNQKVIQYLDDGNKIIIGSQEYTGALESISVGSDGTTFECNPKCDDITYDPNKINGKQIVDKPWNKEHDKYKKDGLYLDGEKFFGKDYPEKCKEDPQAEGCPGFEELVYGKYYSGKMSEDERQNYRSQLCGGTTSKSGLFNLNPTTDKAWGSEESTAVAIEKFCSQSTTPISQNPIDNEPTPYNPPIKVIGPGEGTISPGRSEFPRSDRIESPGFTIDFGVNVKITNGAISIGSADSASFQGARKSGKWYFVYKNIKDGTFNVLSSDMRFSLSSSDGNSTLFFGITPYSDGENVSQYLKNGGVEVNYDALFHGLL